MWDIALATLVAGICVGAFRASNHLRGKHKVLAGMSFAIGVVVVIIIAVAVIETIVFLFTRH